MPAASFDSPLASRSERGVVYDTVSSDDVAPLHVLEAMAPLVEATPARTTQSLSTRDCAEGSTKAETITLNDHGAVAIACDSGVLLVSSTGPGQAQLDYDDEVIDVLLRVDSKLTLHDGALIGAGRLWFRYDEGDKTHPPCLQVLDPDGAPRMMVAMRDHSITLGRALGDLILPAEDDLAPLQLQIIRRDGETRLNNLAGRGKTWLLVPPTQQVPADAVIAVGDRLMQLRSPSPACSEETMPWIPQMQPVPSEARVSFDAHHPA